MQLLDELRAEHERIDAMLDSFRTSVIRLIDADDDPADVARFIRFFHVFADQYHHSREEEVLFTSMVNDIKLPGDHGPIAVMIDDHRQFKVWLDQIGKISAKAKLQPSDQVQLRSVTEEYISAMQHHIDAENSVLFIEGGICMENGGIFELPTRDMNDAEKQAFDLSEDLLLRFPPTPDPDIIRGDGCFVCPAYEVTCDGFEREWPNHSRWNNLDDDPFSMW